MSSLTRQQQKAMFSKVKLSGSSYGKQLSQTGMGFKTSRKKVSNIRPATNVEVDSIRKASINYNDVRGASSRTSKLNFPYRKDKVVYVGQVNVKGNKIGVWGQTGVTDSNDRRSLLLKGNTQGVSASYSNNPKTLPIKWEERFDE